MASGSDSPNQQQFAWAFGHVCGGVADFLINHGALVLAAQKMHFFQFF